MALNGGLHLLDKVVLAELFGADIDCQIQLVQLRVSLPSLELRAGGIEHPLPDLQDNPFSSASGMNCSGGISPRCGCSQRNRTSAPCGQRELLT